MAPDGGDLTFPGCCARCPHLNRLDGSCTHELRQSLLLELDDDRTCPVYVAEKTAAMRRSAESL